jgi:carboxyl-terminal processing protease
MPQRNLIWLLVIPGIVGLGLAIGYSAPAPDKDYVLVRQLVEVLAEVDANYVRELTDEERQKLVENMINGGLSQLDKHSQYFNEQELHNFVRENEGSFGGVGIVFHVDQQTKVPKVASLMPGTPAYEAGVIAGDLIVKVNDTKTENLPTDELRKNITGESGSTVTLTLRREGHNPPEFPVTLTRAQIPVHPIAGVSHRTDDPNRWNWFIDPENKIGLIRIAAFNELTAKEVKAAVEEIERDGGRGLIIDLRDNPGGLLSQAIEVSDLFLTEGKIVTTKDRHGGTKTYSANDSGTLFLPADRKPIAVLVNDHSASASEIVAAALQDNKRAAIVGERTYGKGSVQTLFRLAPNQKTAVKLTTQTWWRPNGKNMDKLGAPAQNTDEWGVSPDEGLAVTTTPSEKLRYEVDEMQRVKYVAGKPDVVGPNPPPPTPVKAPKGQDGKLLWDDSKPFEDLPMNRAKEYLRKKLSGIGAIPRANPIPEMIAA